MKIDRSELIERFEKLEKGDPNGAAGLLDAFPPVAEKAIDGKLHASHSFYDSSEAIELFNILQ